MARCVASSAAIWVCAVAIALAAGAAAARINHVTEAELRQEDADFLGWGGVEDATFVAPPARTPAEERMPLAAALARFRADDTSDLTGDSCVTFRDHAVSGDEPGNRQGAATFVLDKLHPPQLVMVGGRQQQNAGLGEGQLTRADVFSMNTDTGAWRTPDILGVSVPPRVGAAMAYQPGADGDFGGKLVVFGPDLLLLHVQVIAGTPHFEWKVPAVVGDAAPSRRGATLTPLADRRLVLFGGYTEEGVLADVWTLVEGEDGSWAFSEVSASGDAPQPRKGHSAVVWTGSGVQGGPDSVVVYGGSASGKCFADVLVLDVPMAGWEAVATSGDRPAAREGHAAAMVGDSRMIVHGGCDLVAGQCFADVHELNLKTTVWRVVKQHAGKPWPKGGAGAALAAWPAGAGLLGDAYLLTGGCDVMASTCAGSSVLSMLPDAVCPDGCKNGGTYDGAGGCRCAEGFRGRTCEEELPPPPCPGDCSGNGVCQRGECQCTEGYRGPDCSVYCPRNCSGHGTCGVHKCECEEGFRGDACELHLCPDDCTGHGLCDESTGTCACYPGYHRADCAVVFFRECPHNCTSEQHGLCTASADGASATCECKAGWGGADCGTDVHCPGGRSELEACSGHGRCAGGKCVCDDLWTGAACEVRDCPGQCSGHGECDHESGRCTCREGFTGASCASTFECEVLNDCSGHGVCVADMQCECAAGYQGADCSLRICPKGFAPPASQPTTCSGHGDCNFQLGSCDCAPGWAGRACSRRCPAHCSGHGACATDSGGEPVCACQPGYRGADCSQPAPCPAHCSGHGQCFRGQCLCDPAWDGDGCAKPRACPAGCHGRGSCLNGRCFCQPGYSGEACQHATACPANCSSNGRCVGGRCFCDPGFDGPDCAHARPCPRSCSGRGLCLFGRCACEPGFAGPDCAQPDAQLRALVGDCPAGNCSGHGVCSFGRCFCEPGWQGAACGEREENRCPRRCSGNGICQFRQCFCHPGFYGDDCSLATPCPAANATANANAPPCSGHGRCHQGRCFCDPGYSGDACARKAQCPNRCSDRGICVEDTCMCIAGFGGDDCSQVTAGYEICPHSCSGNGVCAMGKCFCDPGWTGAACDAAVQAPCPASCSGHGKCQHGQCFCFPGYDGRDCSQVAECAPGCERHGVCRYGQCFCQDGYTGANCSQLAARDRPHVPRAADKACPNACSMHGVCYDGECLCEPGYEGEQCQFVVVGNQQCPNGCRGPATDAHAPARGLCVLGKCFCYPGFAGEDCGEQVDIPCPDNGHCNGHGHCHYGRCVCDFGWHGTACEEPDARCEDDCSQRGLCIAGECHCMKGFKGRLCQDVDARACPNRCSDHGACVFGTCFCGEQWEGPDCSRPRAAGHTYMANVPESDAQATLHALDGVNYQLRVEEEVGAPRELPREPQPQNRTMHWGGSAHGSLATPADMFKFRAAVPCPADCAGRGLCRPDGTCECDHGWTGADCAQEAACPADCSAHGVCARGACFCDPGWAGADCASTEGCPADCSGHGQCQAARCSCQPGFTGPDCAQAAACPADCSGHGRCARGRCFCDPGFSGDDCAVTDRTACPARCNDRGLCVDGMCYCVNGYEGPECTPIARVAVLGHLPVPASAQGAALTPFGAAVAVLVALMAVAAVVAGVRFVRSSDRQRRGGLHTPLAF